MREAIDHETGIPISTDNFIIKYGNDANENGDHAICPVCDHNLNLRGHHHTDRCPHFCHLPKSGCVIVKKGKTKYGHLTPVEDNPEIIEMRKKEFIDITCRTYLKCHMFCDFKLNAPEYEKILHLATQKGMWRYRDLVLEYVPYILLTYKDMTRKAHHKRLFNMRFVFNSKVKNYSDLWIHNEVKVDFVRLSLKGAMIHKFESFQINKLFNEDDWLSESQKERFIKRTKVILGI